MPKEREKRDRGVEAETVNLMEATARSLEQALAGKVLVQFDRFGQAMRNAYTLPSFQTLVPDLVVCHYDAWESGKAQIPQIYSRERQQKERTKQSGTFYDVPFEAEIANFLTNDQRVPIFKVWFSTEARQKLAQEHGAIILAIPPETREFIEGKTNLLPILAGAETDQRIRLSSVSFADIESVPDYEDCQALYGEVFVMQGRSIGGDGTKIIRTKEEFVAAREKLTGAIKVTEFFAGYSSNTTVVTVPDGVGGCRVFVDIPSHKPTGIAEVGVHETLGAGNDWSQPFPAEHLQQFVQAVEQIGQYLYQEKGLIGIWGVDSIWSDDGVKINEINCRLQGTTEASTVNQILRRFPPFVALHVLSFLGGDTSFLPSQSTFNQETVQLATYEHRAPYYIKIKAKYDYPVRLKDTNTLSGKYRLVDDELEFAAAALSDNDAFLADNEVIIADLPLAESICHPGSELCTITGTTDQKIFKDSRHLSDVSERLVEAIYRKFERVEDTAEAQT